MNRVGLINKVKTRIDEVSSAGDLISHVDIENTKPLDSIIDDLLDESAIEILLKAPFQRLDVTSFPHIDSVPDAEDLTIGKIILPDNFLRLVSFRMNGWKRPVTTLSIEGDDVSRRQSNPYTRGGVSKPVAVLTKSSSSMELHYYSVPEDSDHSVSELRFISKTKAENINDEQMVDAMCWICAGRTLGILGEQTLEKSCYDNAQSLMV